MIICQCFNVAHATVDGVIDDLRNSGMPENKITPGLVHKTATGGKPFAKGCGDCCKTITNRLASRPLLMPTA